MESMFSTLTYFTHIYLHIYLLICLLFFFVLNLLLDSRNNDAFSMKIVLLYCCFHIKAHNYIL